MTTAVVSGMHATGMHASEMIEAEAAEAEAAAVRRAACASERQWMPAVASASAHRNSTRFEARPRAVGAGVA